MNERMFLKEELFDLGLPETALENKIVDCSRWTTFHMIIFQHEGKFWKTGYAVGSTEMNDESPWQYTNAVPCIEVHQVEQLVKVWVPV